MTAALLLRDDSAVSSRVRITSRAVSNAVQGCSAAKGLAPGLECRQQRSEVTLEQAISCETGVPARACGGVRWFAPCTPRKANGLANLHVSTLRRARLAATSKQTPRCVPLATACWRLAHRQAVAVQLEVREQYSCAQRRTHAPPCRPPRKHAPMPRHAALLCLLAAHGAYGLDSATLPPSLPPSVLGSDEDWLSSAAQLFAKDHLDKPLHHEPVPFDLHLASWAGAPGTYSARRSGGGGGARPQHRRLLQDAAAAPVPAGAPSQNQTQAALDDAISQRRYLPLERVCKSYKPGQAGGFVCRLEEISLDRRDTYAVRGVWAPVQHLHTLRFLWRACPSAFLAIAYPVCSAQSGCRGISLAL